MRIYEVIGYLFIGGLILGFSQNDWLEKCGESRAIDTEDMFSVVLWPVLTGAAIVIDDDALRKSECSKEGIK